MRPPPTLLASFKEVRLARPLLNFRHPTRLRLTLLCIPRTQVLSRSAVTQTKGGASKLVRPSLKFQRPIHPGAGARRHASSAAHPTSWRAAVDSFVESIYAGTFSAIRANAPVRQGPYSSARLAPRAVPVSRPAGRPLSSAARARFGPSPRPHAGHSTPLTAHVGLGAARTFSSSGFAVFDNVVRNAPLALRALGDQLGDGGIDRRKWRADTAGIRRAARTAVKGKGKAPAGFDALADKKREFARFFAAAGAVETQADVEQAATEPVTLVLAIDPDFDLAAPSTSTSDPASFRVLSASALDSFASISSAYSSHAHHLRVIVNRLSAAGLLDPEVRASTEVGIAPAGSEHAGRRVWRIVFHDGFVTRSRVESVVRGDPDADDAAGAAGSSAAPAWAEKVREWNRHSAVAAGEGDWWWLLGGETSPSSLEPSFIADDEAAALDSPASFPLSPATHSSASSAASEDSSNDAFLVDAAHALAIAETFVLPDPSFSSSAPSSVISEDEQVHLPWATWTFDSAVPSSQSTVSLLDLDAAGDGDGVALDPAASVWADGSDSSSWGSEAGSMAVLGADEGVRGFLREVEVELGARGAATW